MKTVQNKVNEITGKRVGIIVDDTHHFMFEEGWGE